MQIPGNTWLEMWAAAKPVPARRQKRLFDDTREAEKVLHQLEAKQPSTAAQMMLGPLVHSVLLRLAQQAIPVELLGLTPAIKHIAMKAEVLSRLHTSDMTKYLEICGEVAYAEAMVAQVGSLEHKLCPGKGQTCEMREFLARLVTRPQAAVPGGPNSDIGNRIKAMFSEAHKVAQMIYETDNANTSDRSEGWSPLTTSVFPTASEKEFILRVNIPRPTSSSMVVPHRLTVRLRKDDITMAGCFSQDTTFQ
ncbi:rab3 GTPase-activating protein catalytic subunit-like [Lycorma delicatula]|uniref:rab3 GTPase-activating protein catalytic subunit-like n=1 Tax=Lycorma delicatula TaxID=130591 RepID=UPI003F511A3E